MGSPENGPDEPLTLAGRLFLQKEMSQVIYCVDGVKHPLDIDALKSPDGADSAGREHWRRTPVDTDSHVVVVHGPVADSLSDEEAVNEYLADLSTDSPGLLGDDKPLWDVHLLMARGCLVLRIHHALGDGISLMSMFLVSCWRVDDPEALPTIGPPSSAKRRRGGGGEWWKAVERVGGVVHVGLRSGVRAAEHVGERPEDAGERRRRGGTLAEEVGHGKVSVGGHESGQTINDVLFEIISVGLFKYLDHRSPNPVRERIPIIGVAMVNLREQQGLQLIELNCGAGINRELSNSMKGNPGLRWGNKFGILLLPVHYHRSSGDPLEYLRKAKSMIDRKKKSLEAHFSYRIGDIVMTYLGARIVSLLNYRIVCSTTFTISNVLVPHKEIAVVGNPITYITYIRANSSSLPHAITMHMVSYVGRADMQILVAEDIILDPNFLAKCFEC
ncbi:O-acyltransferase WSD1-like [Eucalyptus grandis]|uniref:O-acyltransferase WSD1-like n=1 Tax=Eucalyptus grandis TaxID=71139 RepID=UPI00192EFB22|nr:O-acyltransferase WSD1-like [Eucalyptus grandis]